LIITYDWEFQAAVNWRQLDIGAWLRSRVSDESVDPQLSMLGFMWFHFHPNLTGAERREFSGMNDPSHH